MLTLLFVCALLGAWILLLRQKRELELLRQDLQHLRDVIAKMEFRSRSKEEETTPASTPREEATPVLPPPLPRPVPPPPLTISPSPEIPSPAFQETPKASFSPDSHEEEAETLAAPPGRDWFSRIIIWVGGVALIMAGFFMIKYSIESGIMTPFVRLLLTTLFGGFLCFGGLAVDFRSDRLGSKRIGQAMTGAGIVCLYFAVYAAVHLYHFFQSQSGFFLMLAVTLIAIVFSLRQGAPVALMGLLGSFLTPLLMGSGSTNVSLLYLYLFLFFCCAQFLCLKRKWLGLLLFSLLAIYAWVSGLLLLSIAWNRPFPAGSLLFILGICLVNAIGSFLWNPANSSPRSAMLMSSIRFLCWGPGLFLELLALSLNGFQTTDLMLFSLLSLAALLLAILRENEFGWASRMGLIVLMLSTLLNSTTGYLSAYIWPASLLLIYFAVTHWRSLKPSTSVTWHDLSISAAACIAPLLFVNRTLLWDNNPSPDAFWLLLFLGNAALLIAAGEHRLFRSPGERATTSLSEFIAGILIVFGLWTYVDFKYYPHIAAIAAGFSALYWRWRTFPNWVLPVGVWAILWCALMYKSGGMAIHYFFSGNIIAHGTQLTLITLISCLLGLIATALPPVLYGRNSGETAHTLFSIGCGFVALLTLVLGYAYWDLFLSPKSWSQNTILGGLTALLAVVAASAGVLESRLAKPHCASAILACLVAIRIIGLQVPNPALNPELTFLNGLALQFGVPLLGFIVLASTMREEEDSLKSAYEWAAMITAFLWGSFLILNYHGRIDFFKGTASHSEIYAYSVVWLLLAVVYLAIGLWKRQRAMHFGSLILLLLTVGKVFLFDAAELEGLYRVLSFLGLGIILLGIGYFYNRIVFARVEEESHATIDDTPDAG